MQLLPNNIRYLASRALAGQRIRKTKTLYFSIANSAEVNRILQKFGK